MRVDFYQLSRDPVENVIPRIAVRLLDTNERLMIVADDSELIERISSKLWNYGPESFLSNGRLDEGSEDRQPILMGNRIDRANGAKNIILADGVWRDPPEDAARIFHFFTGAQINQARTLWRDMKEKADERHYWAQEEGRWVEKG